MAPEPYAIYNERPLTPFFSTCHKIYRQTNCWCKRYWVRIMTSLEVYCAQYIKGKDYAKRKGPKLSSQLTPTANNTTRFKIFFFI